MSRRIAMLGHFGTKNLGDEAIVSAFLQGLRHHDPDVELMAISMNPSDTSQRHGVPARPVRRGYVRPQPAGASDSPTPDAGATRTWSDRVKAAARQVPGVRLVARATRGVVAAGVTVVSELGFLARSFTTLREVDLLVVAGSGQLDDEWGGPFGFPYTILKWAALARLAGARVAFASVGAGPIERRLSAWMIRTALGFADYRSLRDQGSRDLIESIGTRGPLHVRPDLAHSLPRPSPDGPPRPTGGRRCVAVNPLPAYDGRYWPVTDRSKYHTYVAALGAVVHTLLAQDYRVVLFSTQPSDQRVITDLLATMPDHAEAEQEGRLTRSAPRTVDELFALLVQVDAVIATRFHGILLALHLGCPTVAICKDEKQNELMRDMDLWPYRLPFEGLDPDAVVATLHRLESDQDRVRRGIRSHSDRYREELAEQYARLVTLVTDRAGPPPPAAP